MNLFDELLGRTDTGAPALIERDGHVSLGALIRDSESLALLLREAGVARLEPVALWLPLSRELVAAMLAVRSIGAVYSVLGIRSTSTEASQVLSELGCRQLVATSTVVERLAPRVRVGASWRGCVLARQEVSSIPPAFASSDACVIFTSGSTARPKGAVLSEGGLWHNAVGVAEFTCLSRLDRTVVVTPPQFAFAQSQVLTHLLAGAPFVPWAEGVGPHDKVWRLLADAGVTGISANPSSYELLLRSGQGAVSTAPVRYLVSAGQPLLAGLAKRIGAVFPQARLASCFGCTENTLRATYYWVPAMAREVAPVLPVGRPIRGTAVAVVDSGGRGVGTGEVGAVQLRGRSLMRGYLGSLTGNDDAIEVFETGDLGYIDGDGDLHLTGRTSARLNVGNEKVSPEEVESVILGVEGVIDCAVGALPHDVLGEVPVALVAVAHGYSPSDVLAMITATCARLLSRAKRPTRVAFVGSATIPKTEYGKLDRRGVAMMIASTEFSAGRLT